MKTDVVKQNDELMAEIKKRAKLYYNDNFASWGYRIPNLQTAIENAMLIGASIALEKEVENIKKDFSKGK